MGDGIKSLKGNTYYDVEKNKAGFHIGPVSGAFWLGRVLGIRGFFQGRRNMLGRDQKSERDRDRLRRDLRGLPGIAAGGRYADHGVCGCLRRSGAKRCSDQAFQSE